MRPRAGTVAVQPMRHRNHSPFSNLVMGYSKDQKAAKDFLRRICSKEAYDQHTSGTGWWWTRPAACHSLRPGDWL